MEKETKREGRQSKGREWEDRREREETEERSR